MYLSKVEKSSNVTQIFNIDILTDNAKTLVNTWFFFFDAKFNFCSSKNNVNYENILRFYFLC